MAKFKGMLLLHCLINISCQKAVTEKYIVVNVADTVEVPQLIHFYTSIQKGNNELKNNGKSWDADNKLSSEDYIIKVLKEDSISYKESNSKRIKDTKDFHIIFSRMADLNSFLEKTNRIQGFSYYAENEYSVPIGKAEIRLTKKLIDKAKKRAQDLAKVLKMKTGDLIQIEEMENSLDPDKDVKASPGWTSYPPNYSIDFFPYFKKEVMRKSITVKYKIN